MNNLTPLQSGNPIHKIRNPEAVIMPIELPKNRLKIEPVYPISAEISNLRSTIIRAKSIGFDKARANMGFSMG